MSKLVQQLQCGVTAEEYVTLEEDLTTCFISDGAVTLTGVKTYIMLLYQTVAMMQ